MQSGILRVGASTFELLLLADQIWYEVVGSKKALGARGLIEGTTPLGLCRYHCVSGSIARVDNIRWRNSDDLRICLKVGANPNQTRPQREKPEVPVSCMGTGPVHKG